MIVYAFLPDAALLTGTLKLELYPVGPGTIVNGTGGDTLTAVSGQPGWYNATVAETLSGAHRAVLTLDGVAIDSRLTDLDADPAVYGDAASTGGGEIVIENHVVIPTAIANPSPAANAIVAVRGDTLRRALTGLGDLSGRQKLWFTVKRAKGDADSAAMIQITEAVGLIRFKGAAADNAAHGGLTISSPGNASCAILVAASKMAELLAQGWAWDLQVLTAAGDVVTLREGTFDVTADVSIATT